MTCSSWFSLFSAVELFIEIYTFDLEKYSIYNFMLLFRYNFEYVDFRIHSSIAHCRISVCLCKTMDKNIFSKKKHTKEKEKYEVKFVSLAIYWNTSSMLGFWTQSATIYYYKWPFKSPGRRACISSFRFILVST